MTYLNERIQEKTSTLGRGDGIVDKGRIYSPLSAIPRRSKSALGHPKQGGNAHTLVSSTGARTPNHQSSHQAAGDNALAVGAGD